MSGRHCRHCNQFLSSGTRSDVCDVCAEGGKLQRDKYSGNYGPNWQDARAACLYLYDYRCAACLLTDEEHRADPDYWPKRGGLHVHHIKKYWLFDTWDEANAPGNLMPLCSIHHRKVEDNHMLVAEWAGYPIEELLREVRKAEKQQK
jgi:predicted HNH restriction endonuclease